jgi:hypothetical protein
MIAARRKAAFLLRGRNFEYCRTGRMMFEVQIRRIRIALDMDPDTQTQPSFLEDLAVKGSNDHQYSYDTLFSLVAKPKATVHLSARRRKESGPSGYVVGGGDATVATRETDHIHVPRDGHRESVPGFVLPFVYQVRKE